MWRVGGDGGGGGVIIIKLFNEVLNLKDYRSFVGRWRVFVRVTPGRFASVSPVCQCPS